MPAINRTRWTDLPRGTRRLILFTTIAHLALIRVTYADIARKPVEEICGPKRLWRTLTLINVGGAAAYFSFGRRQT